MASAIMNVVKEEIVMSAGTAASVTSTAVSAGRSTVSRSVAASAPSASARVATSSGVKLLGGAVRNEAAHAVQVETQSVLTNLSLAEGPALSSVLGRTTNAEAGTIRSVLPELREQISQAAQQGFGELTGDQAPRLEPLLGLAETAQQIETFSVTK
ncbi:unnamed protein product [Rhizoctonia solani]|uniref:Uncharacterized protein n=3 Tax=Rhizoctonia solani TaxID=456999 RepID=A0A8H3A7C1_9AGAM|nr:hypothetical protein RSOL_321820 [Rhizoctonia solani AG-3 Rhs1AP]KEP52611.1 hypothetical protein V565_042750 [Rhizoctonia solani 123E]CAE6402508.1 unnamed protein product [Rhizoctonia solani]CAE6529819.1 unnamed protein product [Rhizoctonia solani]